jgi:glutamine---fructose-6-phosphate transaminase (isomerizing)
VQPNWRSSSTTRPWKKKPLFVELVRDTVFHMDGAFTLLFVSTHYPSEVVGACRGSPLFVGIKGQATMHMDLINVLPEGNFSPMSLDERTPTMSPMGSFSSLDLRSSTSRVTIQMPSDPMEVFFGSDSAAIVEHTNRILTLQDSDLVHVTPIGIEIRSLAGKEGQRKVGVVETEITDIIKGSYPHFMLKETSRRKVF